MPPCRPKGPTPQEALAEVLIAKEGWLETAPDWGIPIPEPRYRPARRRPKKARAALVADAEPGPECSGL